jgi:hypothetical protein
VQKKTSVKSPLKDADVTAVSFCVLRSWVIFDDSSSGK